MTKAYSYVRFSSDKQAKGDSVRRQTAAFNRYIKDNQELIPDLSIKGDFGVGASKGDNLDPKKSNLGAFIKCCKEGKIERGSHLVMERIDRFSRQHTLAVAETIRELVQDCGINLVFLYPTTITYTAENLGETMQVMALVMALQLAYDESEKKSQRVSERWKDKKKNIKQGEIYTRKLPAWLYMNKDDEIKVNKSKAKTIFHIFELSAKGMGCKKIISNLNEKNIKPITEPTARTPEPEWKMSYISALLNDRRLLGELQPKTQRGNSRRKIDGKSIKDYFPQVIPEELFNANLVQKKERRTLKVVKNRDFVNIFIGLITCTSDGRKMTAISRTRTRNGKTTRNRCLVSTGRRNGKKYCSQSVEYTKFEKLITCALTELKVGDLLLPERTSENLHTLQNNIEATKDRIKTLDEKIKDDRFTSELDSLIELKIEARSKLVDYQNQLDEFIEPTSRTPKETKTILQELKKVTANNKLLIDFRKKLASVIPTIIDGIELTTCKYNGRVHALGLIKLKSGKTRKFILHPTGAEYPIYWADKNSNPTLTIHPCGLIFNEENTKGLTAKDIHAKMKQHKNEPDHGRTFLRDMLGTINETFQFGEYHGDNNWRGLQKHLVPNFVHVKKKI